MKINKYDYINQLDTFRKLLIVFSWWVVKKKPIKKLLY